LADTASTSPLDLVSAFCAAWADLDVDALAGYFTDDALYHNIPMEPVTGRDGIKATIAGFLAGVDRIEFRVLNIAANGPVVLTERIDVFHMPAVTIELPVMGAFEIEDGRIAAWRDYFDLNQFVSQMPG
jgi:limonene-1,2-epoxide hydrolase